MNEYSYHVHNRKEFLQLLLIVVHPGAHDRSVLLGHEIVQPKFKVEVEISICDLFSSK